MSTRSLTILFLAALAAAALAAIWYSFGMPGFGGPLPDESVYRNGRYDYSLGYPRTLTLNEYSSRYVTIGTQDGESFSDEVAATVIRSEEGSFHASFDAFVRSQLPLLCAADSPRETLSCPTVRETGTTTASGGASAATYTLDLVTRDLSSGEARTASFGPVYAYDLSASNPDVPYTALLIFAPVIRVADGDADQELVADVARSVSFAAAATSTPE